MNIIIETNQYKNQNILIQKKHLILINVISNSKIKQKKY